MKESPESDKTLLGHWSLIYDQAVIIQFDDDSEEGGADLRFIVNFMFTLKEESKENLASLDFTEYSDFDSVCDHTMVGLVQRKGPNGFSSTNNSCFYGVQMPSEHREEEVTSPDQKIIFLNDATKEEKVEIEKEEAEKIEIWLERMKRSHQVKGNDDTTISDLQSLVDTINNGKRSWTASVNNIQNDTFAQKRGLNLIQLESGKISNSEALFLAQKYQQKSIEESDLAK